MDRIYRTVNIKDQETQHYYSHPIQHDARQRCPALIVLKEEHNICSVIDFQNNSKLQLYNHTKNDFRVNILCTQNGHCKREQRITNIVYQK